MKKLLMLLLGLSAMTVQAQEERDPEALYAIMETSRGTMEIELYHRVAPLTVTNFVNLSTRGFYDGLTFHRVVNDFMVQGGDPEGDGSGGPGYRFRDEIALRHNDAGILSMANSGPDTNGSQFFITHLATPHLNGLHTVFGKVVEGRELIWELQMGDVIESVSIEGPAQAFLEKRSDQVYLWNKTLDENFPDLEPPLTD